MTVKYITVQPVDFKIDSKHLLNFDFLSDKDSFNQSLRQLISPYSATWNEDIDSELVDYIDVCLRSFHRALRKAKTKISKGPPPPMPDSDFPEDPQPG